MDAFKFLQLFSNVILSLKVRKLSKEVVQLRAELDVFEADVTDKLLTTLSKLSKRIQTRNTRDIAEEEVKDNHNDGFDGVRKLNKGKESTLGM